jgi:hypothetical protein
LRFADVNHRSMPYCGKTALATRENCDLEC